MRHAVLRKIAAAAFALSGAACEHTPTRGDGSRAMEVLRVQYASHRMSAPESAEESARELANYTAGLGKPLMRTGDAASH